MERTISKLKLGKTKLRSLSSEESLSSLLLLAIEEDIKINKSEVISMIKEMANRRGFLKIYNDKVWSIDYCINHTVLFSCIHLCRSNI